MPEQSKQTLSVSIVSYKTPLSELVGLFSSLAVALARALESPAVVYLIDNSEQGELSSNRLSLELPESVSRAMELRLVQGHGNVGFGAGHNMALAGVESEFHLILNPDVVLDEDSLRQGLAFMEANSDVVVASPHARQPDASKQHLCKQYPSLLTFLVRGFIPRPLRAPFAGRLAKYEMHHLPETEPSKGIPIVSGCFMLCRTSALRELQGFDERYFLYFEDFDMSLRMAQLGQNAYVPAMRIEHAGGHAARKGVAHLGMFARSGFRFFNTHGWRFFGQSG